jgi:cytochrome c biogenesis protein CcmG, thiol:disulfide interchange protein DsbE
LTGSGPGDPGVVAPSPRLRIIGALLVIALLTTGAVFAIARLGPPGGGPNIAKGEPVPEFSGTTLTGQTVDLAGLRGRPVIINFWGPSCGPCVDELPLLARKATEHAADGVVILGVLTDDPVEPARPFAIAHGATWQTVIDPDGSIKRAYRIAGRPQTFFVDAQGVLRSIQVGPLTDADFERQLALTVSGS